MFKAFNLCAPFKSSERVLFQLLGRVERIERFDGLNDCLLRVPRPLLFDLFFYFLELHDVAVLVMHIEEIDLV